jgi:flagellar hook protein FlgE
MLGTIYISTSGLQSFSKGLDVISTNVANVNTAGFKGTQLLFQDVYYGYQVRDERNDELYGAWIGHGVTADTTATRFNQGDFRDTKNDTDVALDGKGFFVIDRDGTYIYTRSGQFEFDTDGVLVERGTAHRVMGLGADGHLQSISMDGLKTQPAKPTSTVTLTGNLSLGGTEHTISNVEIIDSLGGKQKVTLKFRNTSTTTPRSWQVEVRDSTDKIIATGGEIRFEGNGSPSKEYNQFKFKYTATNASEQEIVLDFGTPGAFSGATSFSGGTSSDLAVNKQDGFVQGTLAKITFEDTGQLVANYSNNQKVRGAYLALANFNNVQSLRPIDGGGFHAHAGDEPLLGKAGEGNFGRLLAGKIELSNVDLSQQFTDMIVVQRGYQASSQLLTAANEMIQQLLEIGKK